ncbi:DUF2235 domain-containing protein [Luteibacter pinisoli]|uniref:DUF2235 domain-containing protein n=1 Tax=Luteibacter pinisoli TaxID=2589080 RepID=A0A4Y5Z8J6_9GAMM|nr:DUF2235 domain-containing protein [Luteibacter pinisoli]
MKENHKRDGNGRYLDGVDTVFTGSNVLRSFDVARGQLGAFSAPSLLEVGAERQRLFVANFDGTGNHAGTDTDHITNIGRIAGAIAGSGDSRVAQAYVNGPGTDGSAPKRLADNAWGISHDERVRRMYEMFAEKAEEWLRSDPKADIRVLVTGFSRGAEEAASFTRMLHERGVEIETDSGRLRLREGGSIPQAVVLYDPVGTGHPRAHDRRLPPSVVSGIQIVAADERRTQFPSSTIIRRGISRDGRFLGVTVPGSHSDVGGSYHTDGLARATEALVSDYINSLTEDGFVSRPELSRLVADYDMHKSEQHQPFYTTGAFERLGTRDTRGAEAHPSHCRLVDDCAPPEPADVALLERMGPTHPARWVKHRSTLSVAKSPSSRRRYPRMSTMSRRSKPLAPRRRVLTSGVASWIRRHRGRTTISPSVRRLKSATTKSIFRSSHPSGSKGIPPAPPTPTTATTPSTNPSTTSSTPSTPRRASP